VHNDQITDASPTTRRPWGARRGRPGGGRRPCWPAGATAAFAAPAGHAQYRDHHPSIRLVVTKPAAGWTSPAPGATSPSTSSHRPRTPAANNQLSASHGYRPGLKPSPRQRRFGPGMPEPERAGPRGDAVHHPAGGRRAERQPGGGIPAQLGVQPLTASPGSSMTGEVGVPGFFGTNTRGHAYRLPRQRDRARGGDRPREADLKRHPRDVHDRRAERRRFVSVSSGTAAGGRPLAQARG